MYSSTDYLERIGTPYIYYGRLSGNIYDGKASLFGYGNEKIFFLNFLPSVSSPRTVEGYKQALEGFNGMPLSRNLVVSGCTDQTNGQYESMKQLLGAINPLSVMCYSDLHHHGSNRTIRGGEVQPAPWYRNFGSLWPRAISEEYCPSLSRARSNVIGSPKLGKLKAPGFLDWTDDGSEGKARGIWGRRRNRTEEQKHVWSWNQNFILTEKPHEEGFSSSFARAFSLGGGWWDAAAKARTCCGKHLTPVDMQAAA